MNKYRDLAEKARLAAASCRQNDANSAEIISGDLSAPAELAGGKVAESGSIKKPTYNYVTKVSDDHVESGCPVDTPTTPHTHLLNTPKVQKMISSAKKQAKREKARHTSEAAKKAVPVTPWKQATLDEKFRYAGHAADRAGGQAFSLNLSEKTQEKLKRHRDPLRAFTDTLNREMKKLGLSGVPYALTLENSAKDKLHVHGFLIPPDGANRAVRRALRAAGGNISGRAGSRQLDLRKLSDGAGWIFYSRKAKAHTDEVLKGDARLFLNRSMTNAAREFSR